MDAGPEPIDYRDQTLSLITPVIFDGTPIGGSFGDVLEEPPAVVKRGDIVRARFVSIPSSV